MWFKSDFNLVLQIASNIPELLKLLNLLQKRSNAVQASLFIAFPQSIQ